MLQATSDDSGFISFMDATDRVMEEEEELDIRGSRG